MGNPGLTSVNLDHNRLGDDGAIALGSMIANNERNSIQHLRAAECQIEDLGECAFKFGMGKCNVNELRLGFSNTTRNPEGKLVIAGMGRPCIELSSPGKHCGGKRERKVWGVAQLQELQQSTGTG